MIQRHEQPLTMDQCLGKQFTILELDRTSVGPFTWDWWTRDRIGAVIARGIPGTGRLWMVAIPIGSIGVDTPDGSVTLEVRSFEWRLEWQAVEDGPLMHAKGGGATEKDAFENLLKALG